MGFTVCVMVHLCDGVKLKASYKKSSLTETMRPLVSWWSSNMIGNLITPVHLNLRKGTTIRFMPGITTCRIPCMVEIDRVVLPVSIIVYVTGPTLA